MIYIAAIPIITILSTITCVVIVSSFVNTAWDLL